MFHKIAILVAALAVIFPGELRCEQNGEPGVITGTVTYLQRMALPPDAVVDVQLRDVSLQDVPAKVIAESTIATAEKQVPIAFRIPFAIADINSAHIYAVGATITFGGNVMFSSTASYPVITRGAPTQIEIVVRPILAEEAPAHEAAHGLQVLKPVTFAGDLPCADCAGMRFTLTLRPDGIFLSRTNYRGKGKPFHDLGRWSLPNDGTRLVLFSGNHAPQLFAIKNADTLRLLDVEGHEIVSKLNYDLKRDVEVDPIGDTFRFTGEFVHVADAGLITECRTGARWPVAQEGDNPVLERAYSASGTGAGQPVLVTFEGHFVSRPRMEGSGEQEMIVIDQFAQLGLPDKRCVSHQAATQIEHAATSGKTSRCRPSLNLNHLAARRT